MKIWISRLFFLSLKRTEEIGFPARCHRNDSRVVQLARTSPGEKNLRMEICRMCAIALTRTASMVDATLPLHFLASSRLSSKQIDSRTRKASLMHNPRCVSRHLHGYQRPPPSRPLEQPSRPLSHQIQLQRQQQPSSRPKSFKELVEMQKQQREMDGGSKGRLFDTSIDDRRPLEENSSSSAESPVSDSPHTRRIPSLPARMANSWRKMRQSSHEIDAKIETTLKEEMPGYSLAVVRAFTRSELGEGGVGLTVVC